MKTILIIIAITLSACGQAPQNAEAPKPVIPDVWVGCWEPWILPQPNDCGDLEVSYCVVDGEAFKYSDRTKAKLSEDSCQYKLLTEMGAFKKHGWGS